MQDLLSHFDQQFLGNRLGDWLLAGAVFAGIFLVVEFIRGLVRTRRERWQRAGSPALELFGGFAAATSRLVVISVALYFAEELLHLPPRADRIFEIVIVAGIAVQLALWATVALGFGVDRHYRRQGAEDTGARASVGALMFLGQLAIWAVFALLALDNLGINITALVAGLGVGGIAVALAVQTILSDLFGSMSIALDKPFTVGDQLRIDDVEGTVEYIGIKSTRLRSVSGEQVILANADVLKSRVRNLGRMPQRRVQARLRIVRETPAGLLDKVPVLAREAVEAAEGAHFVSCLLALIGEYALEYELVYTVVNRGGLHIPQAMDIVNRGILARFAAAGVVFAYPSQRQVS